MPLNRKRFGGIRGCFSIFLHAKKINIYLLLLRFSGFCDAEQNWRRSVSSKAAREHDSEEQEELK